MSQHNWKAWNHIIENSVLSQMQWVATTETKFSWVCTLSPGWLLSAHQMVYLLVTQLVLWPNKAPPSQAHSSLSQDGDREGASCPFRRRHTWSGPRIWTWTLPGVEGWRRRDVGSGFEELKNWRLLSYSCLSGARDCRSRLKCAAIKGIFCEI